MGPEISVVVASHDRPLRLRWLLNALEEQTLERGRWEVVVGHDSAGAETEQLLRTHPLAADGTLRHVTLPPGSAPPGKNRNAAWRIARAPLVAFTDDDCRPPRDWLERALEAARAHPGAIVQGATYPDPDEQTIRMAPHYHSQRIHPPVPYAQACNIVYPRELLERAGGFDEVHFVGEDTDLAVRCRALGADYVGAPEVVTFHAVEEKSLLGILRGLMRWHELPWLVKRHPELREVFPMRFFWKPTHVWLPFAFLGAVLSRRNPLALLLAVPWAANSLPRHGTNTRGRYRALAEMPDRIAIDTTEFAVLAKGSIENRTLFL